MWRNIIILCGLLLLIGGMYSAYGGLKHSAPKQMTVVEFAADERAPVHYYHSLVDLRRWWGFSEVDNSTGSRR